jgi:hypothetical protein
MSLWSAMLFYRFSWMRLLEFKYVSGALAPPKESFPEGKL